MRTRLTTSSDDISSLVAMVTEVREDVPEQGLPHSLLRDLMVQIPCDYVLFQGYDTEQEIYWFAQRVTEREESRDSATENLVHRAFWQHYWDCEFCCYPDRTGEIRSVLQVTDFYSLREWHSTGMYSEVAKPQGFEHYIGVYLPEPCRPDGSPKRIARLFLARGPGREFSERDRGLLMLLRPHLQQAFVDVERRRNLVPNLTPRQWELLDLLAAGRTNTQIARQLGVSEGTVRTHLENIYGRLQVSNRTAAVTSAFRGRVA